MPTQINAGYIHGYNMQFEALLRQRGSRLMDCVYNPPKATSKIQMTVEQIGSTTVNEQTQRHQPITLTDPSHDARWVRPRNWWAASGVDERDLLRRMQDPSGQYMESHVDGMGDKIDDLILVAFFGTALTGEDGDTSVAFAADGGFTVSVGTTGLTLDKIREGKTDLRGAEALHQPMRDPVFCAIAAQQHDDLLSETQVISLDYTSKPRLENDEITSFMGTIFKDSQRLNTSGGDQLVPMWTKSGMALQMWKGVSTEIKDRPDLIKTKQILTTATFDATRQQGPKVVQIVCDL